MPRDLLARPLKVHQYKRSLPVFIIIDRGAPGARVPAWWESIIPVGCKVVCVDDNYKSQGNKHILLIGRVYGFNNGIIVTGKVDLNMSNE